MFSKHSLDGNRIGDEGCVAVGVALKVNKTLQTLRLVYMTWNDCHNAVLVFIFH